MMRRADTTAVPSLHIGQLRFVTDRAFGAERGQALGERFADELVAELIRTGADTHLEIGELLVEASSDQLDDARSLSRLAAAVARRILDRAPD
jgi:hypothetical protein